MTKDFSAVILAAGKGTRFESETIKVLHRILGKSMLQLVAEAVCGLQPESLFVIVGHQKERIMEEKFSYPVRFAVQKRPLGTADAVLAAKDLLMTRNEKSVLVMNADLPLVRTDTLLPLLQFHRQENNALTFLTGDLEDPTGFGRVMPGDDGIIRIVEEKDATSQQRKIKNSNLGIYCFDKHDLFLSIPKISNENAKGEYYLTDIIEIMMRAGMKCAPFRTENTDEFIGVNDRREFEAAAEVLRVRKIEKLIKTGVQFLEPDSCKVDLDVSMGENTIIHSDVRIEGECVIGQRCKILSHARIKDSHLGDDVQIGEGAELDRVRCGNGASIGNSLSLSGEKIANGQNRERIKQI